MTDKNATYSSNRDNSKHKSSSNNKNYEKKKKMPVEVAAGPTLKSTVNLPSETQNGDEMKDQKIMTTSSGFNLLQSIKKEHDKGDEEHEEEEIVSGSDDTCSIGECSSADADADDDDETREDEVQSKPISDQYLIQIKSSLTSLDSLEDSLPIKRGLSNFYSGKSKSFTSLSNAANATAKDLVKPENPLNKRRRLLIAWSRNRRASCSSLVSIAESESPLMPVLQRLPSVVCEEEEEEEVEVEDESSSSFSPSERMRREKEKRRPSLFTVTVAPPEIDHDHDCVLSSISIGKMALRSPGRSLSLSDLNRHAHAMTMTMTNLD